MIISDVLLDKYALINLTDYLDAYAFSAKEFRFKVGTVRLVGTYLK